MFSKAEKNLHESNNFNPPPGYYPPQSKFDNKNYPSVVPSFPRQERFEQGQNSSNPGPGAYYNDRAEKIKKRIIEESKKRDGMNKAGGQSEIKISSIPSIPKKSATRVYEELAPGILILHEEQNENTNIGPGTYNVDAKIGQKKPIAHKINPQHKKKAPPPEPEIKVPTIAEEIRNEKRMMYKRNLIKSTGVNKSMISPSDLCLEVIILRERLMRGDENPPPGNYYNEKYQSSFKQADPDLLPEYQLMMGREERFKEEDYQGVTDLGPGSYDPVSINNIVKNPGGFIPKQERKMHSQKKNIPGPGAYKIEHVKAEALDPKGNYPPIFGSGCNRFYSVDKKSDTTPGPGSYKLDTNKKKKQKFIKVKKNFYESQFVKPQQHQQQQQTDENSNQELFSMSGDKSKSYEQSMYSNRAKNRKNNHYFASKVERFKDNKKNEEVVGPANYNITDGSFVKDSFNRNKEGYIGTKQGRFDDSRIRPNLGPGAYFTEGSLKKQ